MWLSKVKGNKKNFLADGAMDNYATYRFLSWWNMIPFIPLDSNARVDYVKASSRYPLL